MPDMKLEIGFVDLVYTQLYDYYMLLEGMGRGIPLDLLHAMRTIEDKFRRAADREEYRKEKGYR